MAEASPVPPKGTLLLSERLSTEADTCVVDVWQVRRRSKVLQLPAHLCRKRHHRLLSHIDIAGTLPDPCAVCRISTLRNCWLRPWRGAYFLICRLHLAFAACLVLERAFFFAFLAFIRRGLSGPYIGSPGGPQEIAASQPQST